MVTMPGQFPRSLLRMSWWTTLAGVPAVVVHPARDADPGDPPAPDAAPVPTLIWMHGRTASKELDPGRYLRLAREGIGTIALDLPGHGGREDLAMQAPLVNEGRADLARRHELDGGAERVAEGEAEVGRLGARRQVTWRGIRQ